VIVVLANAVPAVVMGRRRGATDYRLAEVDPEAEQRNQAGEQRHQWHRGPQVFGPEFSSVKHV
jgi:hypothetical protein